MTACSKDEIVEQYNQALQAVGDNGLTKDSDLQGKRSLGADSYVGTYEADYESFSGKEILFGGTALERDDGNEIKISCNMDITSGTLKSCYKQEQVNRRFFVILKPHILKLLNCLPQVIILSSKQRTLRVQ